MNNLEELKPCPFCGGKAHLLTSNGSFLIECSVCLTDFLDGPVGIGWYRSEKDAAAGWNDRPSERALIAQLEAVQLDATRWRAMLSSPAIRILGYAGLQDDKPIDGHYCHFGMEIWSHYEPYYDNKKAGELITRYADNMIAASLVEGNADAS